MKKFFLVKADFDNTRLDRWFKKNICSVPQSLIEKNIRKGNIKVNGRKKKSSYKRVSVAKKKDLVKVNQKKNRFQINC